MKIGQRDHTNVLWDNGHVNEIMTSYLTVLDLLKTMFYFPHGTSTMTLPDQQHQE